MVRRFAPQGRRPAKHSSSTAASAPGGGSIFGPKVPCWAEDLVARLEEFEHDRGRVDVDVLVAAGGAGEIPHVDDQVGRPRDQRHLDRHLAAVPRHRPLEHARLAQRLRGRGGLLGIGPAAAISGVVVDLTCGNAVRAQQFGQALIGVLD